MLKFSQLIHFTLSCRNSTVHLCAIKQHAMKKLIFIATVILVVASCREKVSPAQPNLVEYKSPSLYYSSKTNDYKRIFHALKLGPLDVYVSSSMINR
jgi:hypothetical protein